MVDDKDANDYALLEQARGVFASADARAEETAERSACLLWRCSPDGARLRACGGHAAELASVHASKKERARRPARQRSPERALPEMLRAPSGLLRAAALLRILLPFEIPAGRPCMTLCWSAGA
eukprot:6196919-Pleurochrysis_carterae.AAC.1